jgi:hypothetical protein
VEWRRRERHDYGMRIAHVPHSRDALTRAKAAKPRRWSGRRRGARRDFRREIVGKCDGGFEVGSLGRGDISEVA